MAKRLRGLSLLGSTCQRCARWRRALPLGELCGPCLAYEVLAARWLLRLFDARRHLPPALRYLVPEGVPEAVLAQLRELADRAHERRDFLPLFTDAPAAAERRERLAVVVQVARLRQGVRR